jgi:hypothetical protein
MNFYVIMHNMIIENEHEAQVEDDQPLVFQGPPVQVNDVPANFLHFLPCNKKSAREYRGASMDLERK